MVCIQGQHAPVHQEESDAELLQTAFFAKWKVLTITWYVLITVMDHKLNNQWWFCHCFAPWFWSHGLTLLSLMIFNNLIMLYHLNLYHVLVQGEFEGLSTGVRSCHASQLNTHRFQSSSSLRAFNKATHTYTCCWLLMEQIRQLIGSLSH